MKIREYGEIILCKDITFEDNKVDENKLKNIFLIVKLI